MKSRNYVETNSLTTTFTSKAYYVCHIHCVVQLQVLLGDTNASILLQVGRKVNVQSLLISLTDENVRLILYVYIRSLKQAV